MGIKKVYGNNNGLTKRADKLYTNIDNKSVLLYETSPIVSWSTGTDEEIATMLAYIDESGDDLSNYWTVGDERTVHLGGDIDETVTFVIEDIKGVDGWDGKTSGGTQCHAVVGQKNGLTTTQKMNSNNTNSGGYNSTKIMKPYIEGTYQTALQNATSGNFWSSVISAVHKQQIYSSGLKSTTAKVIIHSIFETHAAHSYAPDETTANGFHQFKWYETSDNRVKKTGDSGSADYYWSRSAYTGNSNCFWYVTSGGGASYYNAFYSYLVAPFCCI